MPESNATFNSTATLNRWLKMIAPNLDDGGAPTADGATRGKAQDRGDDAKLGEIGGDGNDKVVV
jgi:hypothetical protein